MKKIALGLVLLVALKASCQTVDTTITNCIAAKIVNVNYKSGIPAHVDTLTHIGVFDYTDDLKGNCIANWVLISNGRNILWNNYKLTEADYNSWDSSPEGLLSIIGKFLGITFK